MDNRLLGLKCIEFRRLAYQFAVKLEISHNFNDATGNNRKNSFSFLSVFILTRKLCLYLKIEEAGKDWMRSFMKRHNLSRRKSEHTSRARANGFNKEAVMEFFTLLDDLNKKHKFHPDDIYNVDETGITIVPKNPSYIVSSRGKRQVGNLSEAERGETVSAEICMSATGKFMPLLLIFPRVKENKEFLIGAPTDAKAEFHKSGYMTTDIFTR